MVELLPARFQGPPFFGCYLFFWPLFPFFSSFFCFFCIQQQAVAKKPYFYRVFCAHPSKASSDIMQQQWTKPKLPKKKVHLFFGGNPFFDHFFFSKTLILHHPLKTVHEKISQNPYFYRLKKSRPGYWPYPGQVIDPTLAKIRPGYWPYSICIYIYAVESKCGPRFAFFWVKMWSKFSLFFFFFFSKIFFFLQGEWDF